MGPPIPLSQLSPVLGKAVPRFCRACCTRSSGEGRSNWKCCRSAAAASAGGWREASPEMRSASAGLPAGRARSFRGCLHVSMVGVVVSLKNSVRFFF